MYLISADEWLGERRSQPEGATYKCYTSTAWRLHNLSESVTSSVIYILSDEMEKREADVFDLDAAYSTPVPSRQFGPGQRPWRYDISKDQLEHFRSLFFSCQKIADMLHVSASRQHSSEGSKRGGWNIIFPAMDCHLPSQSSANTHWLSIFEYVNPPLLNASINCPLPILGVSGLSLELTGIPA